MMDKFSVVAFSLLLSASALQAAGGQSSDDENYGEEEYVIPAKGQPLELIKRPTSEEARPIAFDPDAPLKLMNKQNMINYRGHPFGANSIIQHNGRITVATNIDRVGYYQLETERFLINKGDMISASYKIKVHPGGKVAVGFLDTSRGVWKYGIRWFEEGTHIIRNYGDRIPEGESETSLVFFNGHRGTPGASTFTIKWLKIGITPASAS